MKVTEVKIGRLKAGPGRFENERLEVTVAVADGESAAEAVKRTRTFINKQLHIIDPDFDDEEIKNATQLLQRAGKIPVEGGMDF